MPPCARRHNTSQADFAACNESTVRAVLLPRSESALFIVQLAGNQRWNSPVTTERNSLPSPSSSDDEGGSPPAPSRPTENTTRGAKRKRNNNEAAIVLRQSRDQERFTLGASPNNDVILRHPDHSDLKCCYINFLHLQLYPDPDGGGLVLSNNSTSTFDFSALPTRHLRHTLVPGQEARLGRGSWQLRLGAGLDFEIKILPYIPKPQDRDPSLQSPTATSVFTTPGAKIVAAQPRKLQIPKKHVLRTLPTDTAVVGKKDLKADCTVRRVRGGTKDTRLHPVPDSIPDALPPVETIGQTKHSEVTKAIRNGTIVAVKKCREPKLSSSADAWKKELDILSRLQHPSVITLVHHDARDLSLELEYIGPDLAQFIDSNRMSRLSEDLQHRIWIDISRGLEYLHAENIIHLDIKPQNILLSKSGRAVLCDFGASIRGASGPISYNGGTPCYVPPEYVLDYQRWFPGDVWAFGVTLLFVFGLICLPRHKWIIADVPFDASAQMDMFDWLDEVQRACKDIPEYLSLLRSMLARNPRKRITASKLVHELQLSAKYYAPYGCHSELLSNTS